MKKCFALMMMVGAFMGCLLLTGCGNDLEESAKPVVTSILKEQLGSDAAECISVKITEKVDDTHYKAKATLDNGNDIKIMIEDRGEEIYVTIPFDQD